MKITKQIFSIPPYISTTWANIASLSMVDGAASPLLVVELIHGDKITIPGLDYGIIEHIFTMHQQVVESPNKVQVGKGPVSFSLPFQLFGEGGLEKMGMLMQHNPDEFHAPPLPPEVIDKISSLIKGLGLSDTTSIPAPEEGCNCNFCQVARTIHDAALSGKVEKIPSEEPVTDEDLHFHNWDIDQKGEQLYEVTNPLDQREHYQVYLGKPIGCTCGSANCEHIRAVLQS